MAPTKIGQSRTSAKYHGSRNYDDHNHPKRPVVGGKARTDAKSMEATAPRQIRHAESKI